MAGSARPGSRRTAAERLARIARRVVAWEGAAETRVDLTLLDAAAMRRLNRRATGRRALTDVIAFALPQPDGTLLGDVYICPQAAHEGADELVRLAVHGTLHVLGYDHPEGPGRTRCVMWRRQERYVRRLC
ncbi:MAG TPA: rRNA maturation RNase YbeY [Gemmatimonadales bacterium]|nr:rRNA maturation RNase YbeY [Gemmatimonadales bacterium]